MHNGNKIVRACASGVCVIAGNVLYALTARLFLIPSGLITGGTTGIALAMNHYWGISVSLTVLIFGVAMLLMGLLLLGKQFAITTVISTFAYPLSLRVLEHLLGDMVLTQDIFLNVLFSGLGIGLSLSIIIRAGASSGGMDIPPLILERYLKIPVSVSLYVFDFCILLIQIPYNSMDMALYGIVLVLIYTVVLDRLILTGTSKTEVKVVSLKADEIREKILSELDRGVTIIHAKGGYLQRDTELVFSVISNRELPRLEKLIREIDSESFVVVSRVSEVSGRGFSMDKAYR